MPTGFYLLKYKIICKYAITNAIENKYKIDGKKYFKPKIKDWCQINFFGMRVPEATISHADFAQKYRVTVFRVSSGVASLLFTAQIYPDSRRAFVYVPKIS